MLHGAVQVDGVLHVDQQGVGPGVGEGVEVAVGLGDHQVDLQGQARDGPQRLHDHGAHADVRHEVAVHDVHVDAVGAGGLGLADLLAQPGEVGGQDRRRQLDGDSHVSVLAACVSRAAAARSRNH